MLKVFLVEDEVVIRNGIKNSIPWEREGFEFVGEASDGELACPLIMKEKPDILITDIRMPFMDGLELSRIVKRELPQIKIIILSGFDEFDYARTAIDLGVTRYLLKPINSAGLLKEVKEVAALIEKEREQDRLLERYRAEREETLILERHRLWNALISNELSAAELLEHAHSVGLDLTASAYQVFLFKTMMRDGSTGCSSEAIALSDRVVEASRTWEDILTFDRSPEGWAFVIKAEGEEEAAESLNKCSSELTALVREYPSMEYFGGVGSVVHRTGEIRNSYQEAGKAFAGRFFTEPDKILLWDQIPGLHRKGEERIDVTALGSRKSQRELVDKFLRSGTVEEAEDFLEEYFLDVGEENWGSLLYRQYLLMDLYFSATDFLESIRIPRDSLPRECRDINEITGNGAASVSEMKRTVKKLFTETMKLRDGSAMKRYGAILDEARHFIQENYQKEDMSLNTVAARVNVSPSYFSSIFSAQTGQTFVEYLTSVRLDKARELLMCSSLRTAEIAYQVGYRDAHYFSYIFKKVVGCSPTEYKNRRKE